MPSKKSIHFANFAGAKQFFRNRTAAIGLIVVCILGTGILIAARTSETASPSTQAAKPQAAAPAVRPATASVTTTVVNAKVAAKPQGAEAKAPERVTIEGCLVQDDETFRLKDTSGEDAPKGRSWKSFGLHKGSKTLEVVDARHRLNLAKHVGERVSVTGMLDDKELQGTALKRLAEACN
jgi:hypothetical protein